MRRTCRICGADVGSADFDLCGRHSCQRGRREPGADDDLGELLVGIDAPEPLPVSSPTPDVVLLTARLADSARRREVVWLQNRISLLRRCAAFGPEALPCH